MSDSAEDGNSRKGTSKIWWTALGVEVQGVQAGVQHVEWFSFCVHYSRLDALGLPSMWFTYSFGQTANATKWWTRYPSQAVEITYVRWTFGDFTIC